MPPKARKALSGGIAGALGAVARTLSSLPAPGMIIGGVAAILHGVPRLTRDVDATVDANSIGLEDLLARFSVNEIVPRIDDALAFAKTSQVCLLRHGPTRVDVDLSLAWLPFELEAIAARQHITRGRVRADVARPEDLVIYKAVAWRPQDQQDIERLLTLYAPQMDLARVREIVRELAAALDDPHRMHELDALIQRVVDRG